MTPKRGKKNDNKKASTPVTAMPEPQPLQAVLRALVRLQTRALILEHVAELVATTFRGNDCRPPTKLLAFANGTRCRAEIDDVVEVEAELQRLAYAARVTMNALNQAGVMVDPAVLQRGVIPRGPLVPPPADEGVAENPASKSAASTADGAKRP